MQESKQKIAVVTGGAGGIGAACALSLAEEGYDLVIIDLKETTDVVEKIIAMGRKAELVQCDITDPEKIKDFQKYLENTYGRCDLLLNNAGIYTTVRFEDLDYKIWRKYMALNLDAPFLMSQAVLPLMKKRERGRIINIVSNSFFQTPPGLTAYVTSKGGCIGLVRGMASDLGGYGITVNAVAPGPILTEKLKMQFYEELGSQDEAALNGFFDMIGQSQAIKRPGMPNDVAGVIGFLSSEKSDFVSGQTIVVDGGYVRI